MNATCPHCAAARVPPRKPPPTKRLTSALDWIVPSALLAVVPKCPVCVAAYVALLTGCGISIVAATTIRLALITTCLATVTFVAVRTVRHHNQPRSGDMT